MRILVVEDEPALRVGLVDLLESAGHEVTATADGESAVDLGTRGAFDLVLLDVMLPKLSGDEVCRRLRRVRPAIPILMLTARAAEDDKVVGLRAGADDYVTKPFGVRELLARIDALARRAATAPEAPEAIAIGAGVELDLGRCVVRRGNGEITLTPREVGVLRWLHRHRSRAVPRSELLENVWGMVPDLKTRTVDMTVAKLRRKIEPDPGRPTVVVTVTGVGYAWGGGA